MPLSLLSLLVIPCAWVTGCLSGWSGGCICYIRSMSYHISDGWWYMPDLGLVGLDICVFYLSKSLGWHTVGGRGTWVGILILFWLSIFCTSRGQSWCQWYLHIGYQKSIQLYLHFMMSSSGTSVDLFNVHSKYRNASPLPKSVNWSTLRRFQTWSSLIFASFQSFNIPW